MPSEDLGKLISTGSSNFLAPCSNDKLEKDNILIG